MIFIWSIYAIIIVEFICANVFVGCGNGCFVSQLFGTIYWVLTKNGRKSECRSGNGLYVFNFNFINLRQLFAYS